MAFNGSGLFSRLYNWAADRDASIKITASRMDAEMDGMATGLSTCIAKDGQTTVTANLPMATYKHTGVGAANARTDYADTASVQDDSFNYITETGAADAYVISPSPAITAYAAGQRFTFIATNASTGASTLNVSGLGVKSIVKNVSAALAAGDIAANAIVSVIYDGTNFQLLSLTIVNLSGYLQTSDIGVTVQAYDADTTKNDVANTFTQTNTFTPAQTFSASNTYSNQQYFAEATLTDGANISWNLNTAQEAKVTLDGNRTLDNPTNQVAGAWYNLRVIQDAVTGSRTLSYGTAYNFGDLGAPTLSTATSAEDVLSFRSNGTDMQYMGASTGVHA